VSDRAGVRGGSPVENVKHISVCICTYKRARFLTRLLNELGNQKTEGLFTFSIVVADNDEQESARAVVNDFGARSTIPVRYCVEPRQNIALTRNKALEYVEGDFVAFIDDDEFPPEEWLLTLFKAWQTHGVDGVLGPVKPSYEGTPPSWVVKGKFYDRPSYPTGFVIDWRKGRTGNVLLDRRVFEGLGEPFRPQFLTGEDQDFFRRAIEKGHRFIWCHEAIAYEEVPAIRWQRSFMLRRALLRGSVSIAHPSVGASAVAKSAVAAVVYAGALPFSWIVGEHGFMTCLVRFCDHAGRVLAWMGIKPVKQSYVTE
jgi:glycosyltransferase involved in cell wall biosynthesis